MHLQNMLMNCNAHVFSITYGLKYIGIRYFNVFGRRQDPNSAYAAVIPLFIKKILNMNSQ